MAQENQKIINSELSDREEKFRGIASAARDAIFMINDEGVIEYINAAGEALFGYTSAEVMGERLHELLAPPEYKARYEQGITQFRETGTGPVMGAVIELDALKKDGSRITIELSLSAQRLKERWHAIGICRDITERKRLEHTLREREEFLNVIYTNIDMAVFVIGVSETGEFRITGINPTHERLTGLKNAEIAGKEPHEFLPDKVADAVVAHYRRCYEVGAMTEYEESIPFQGRETWWTTRLIPIKNTEGRIYSIIGASMHITERREMERRLMNTLDFTRRILENSPVGIIIYNSNGDCITANQSAADILGAPGLLDVLNQNFYRIESWKASGFYESALRALKTGERVAQTACIRTSFGRNVWLDAQFMPFSSGDETYMLFIASDVTEIKNSEQDAHDRNEFISTLLDTIPDPVFYKDLKGVYLGCNRAFENFIGIDRQRLVGKTVYDIAPRELAEEYARKDDELLSGPGRQQYEFRVKRADGVQRDVIFNKASFYHANGGIAGLVGTIIDITETKDTERYLKEISLRDELTGLGNRRSYNEMARMEWNRAARDITTLSLVLIDIDFFKKYNDHFGHLRGDDCLAKIAGTLKSACLRPADFIARYGGEEFAAVLPGTDAAGAVLVAERMRNAVAALALEHPTSTVAASVTVSIGTASTVPKAGADINEFFHSADEALYAAKEGGRNRIESAAPLK